MVDISRRIFPSNTTTVECPNCKYKITKPYPKDCICPNCQKFVPDLLEKASEEEEREPQEFSRQERILSTSPEFEGRIEARRVLSLTLDNDIIALGKGEYLKLIGITSIERAQLYCSNDNYKYLLELTNNLDFIATSMLSGELDKMLLISMDGEKEKCQFYTKSNLIYLIYGVFPDKKGKWLLEQLSSQFLELVRDKDLEHLNEVELRQLAKAFKPRTKSILEFYIGLQEVFTDQEIPYVEDKIRIDYIGLSSQHTGVISLLIGEENLNIETPQLEDPEKILEHKEDKLTAQIQAIAANTEGNTQAIPRWIAVKLGFQEYRFLTFKKYQNEFFLYMISEGNLGKIEQVEQLLDPEINKITTNSFTGNLEPFNNLRLHLKQQFSKRKVFPPFSFEN